MNRKTTSGLHAYQRIKTCKNRDSLCSQRATGSKGTPKADFWSAMMENQEGCRRIMEEKKKLVTYAGLKALQEELHDLKVVRRKEVAEKIKEAREQGDLSENAEYDAAKDEQREIEARIEEIDKILKNVEVVVEDEVDFGKINVGCTVKLYDVEFDEEMEYKIVGSSEANSLQGKISNESPVGRALIGKQVGDVVEVETQAGTIEYRVLGIQRSV